MTSGCRIRDSLARWNVKLLMQVLPVLEGIYDTFKRAVVIRCAAESHKNAGARP